MTYSYHEVLNVVVTQVQQLTPDEQLQLLKDLETFIRLQEKPKARHRVTEFKGMDKETWKGISVQEYIDRERDSWDG